MINNGYCDRQCNNWECGHDFDECSWEDVMEECLLGHGVGWGHIKSVPGNYSAPQTLGTNKTGAFAMVEAKLENFQPITFGLDSNTDVWSIGIVSTLTLRWQDSRLKTVACTAALSEQLSMRSGEDTKTIRAEKEAFKSEIWFPRTQISGTSIDYLTDALTNAKTVLESTFSFEAGDTGIPFGEDAGATCYDCASYNVSMVTSLDLKGSEKLNFAFFPFDVQTFRFTVSIGKARLVNCENILSDTSIEGAQAILPTTGEWVAINMSTGIADPKTVGTCKVEVRARRNSLIFILKQIVPSIIVVYAGLCALFLTASDHTGDRVALILVSILILMVNFQTGECCALASLQPIQRPCKNAPNPRPLHLPSLSATKQT